MVRNTFFRLVACITVLGFSPACLPHCRAWHNSVPPLSERAGELEVRIVGPRHNVIEVYFHNQGVDLDQFKVIQPPSPDTPPLQYCKTVIVARHSPYGTFAVIYGNHQEKIMAFGWREGTVNMESFELPTISDHPVRVEWVTAQILRVEYGKHYSQEYVFEFNPKDDPDQAWRALFPANAYAGQK
jgi:hypothetical protein